jgi:hypothetical protein
MASPQDINASIAAAIAKAAQLKSALEAEKAPEPTFKIPDAQPKWMSDQLASVYSLINSIKENKTEKKVVHRAHLLDAQGREIDESGNLVRQDTQIKTLAANVAVGQAMKKKENPYLAHRAPSSTLTVPGFESVAPAENSVEVTEVIDDRLVVGSRDRRGKKALSFARLSSHPLLCEELVFLLFVCFFFLRCFMIYSKGGIDKNMAFMEAKLKFFPQGSLKRQGSAYRRVLA